MTVWKIFNWIFKVCKTVWSYDLSTINFVSIQTFLTKLCMKLYVYNLFRFGHQLFGRRFSQFYHFVCNKSGQQLQSMNIKD